MKLTLWRAFLAPLTSIRALLIKHRSRTPLSYDAAWRQARMLRCPDEMVYRLHGHQATSIPGTDRAPSSRFPSDPV